MSHPPFKLKVRTKWLPKFLWEGHFTGKRIVTVDTETLLIRPALQTPPIACVSTYEFGVGHRLWGAPEYRQHLDEILPDDTWIVMHNAPFDLWEAWIWLPGAKERILRAIDEGRVICTLAFQRCIEIATPVTKGPLQLDLLAQRWGIHGAIEKENSPRLLYGRMIGRPASEFPEDFKEYAKGDPEITDRIVRRQMERAESWFEWRRCVPFVTMRGFCFADYRNYGQRTDPDHLEALEAKALSELTRLKAIAQEPFPVNLVEAEEIERLEAELLTNPPERRRNQILKRLDDFRVVRVHGKTPGNRKRLQALVNKAYDGKPPKTFPPKERRKDPTYKPQISTSHDTLVDSGDPMLTDLADYGAWSKVVNADLKWLKDGAKEPIHTKYTIADTLRIISSDPNLTNLRVKSGIREAFAPRPGFCFIEWDHSALEFIAVSQITYTALGDSHMRDQVNNGIDSHLLVVKEITNEDYETAKAKYKKGTRGYWGFRQSGKVVNYGCLGFMTSEESIKRYGRKYDLKEEDVGRPVDLKFWRMVLQAWRRAQPGSVAYLERYVRRLPKTPDGRFITQIWGIQMPRYGVTLTAAANTPFQSLGACIEALVAWALLLEMNDPESPLYHCRVVSQVHDSFVLECPLHLVTAAFDRMHYIMTEAPKPFLPDVKLAAEGVATMRISKAAKLHRLSDDGEVLIWVADGKWLSGLTGETIEVKETS